MKITAAQESLLNEIKDEYARYQMWFDQTGGKAMDGVSDAWWVKYFKQGVVEIKADSKTIDCLERLGYIEVVERREIKHHRTGRILGNRDVVRLING